MAYTGDIISMIDPGLTPELSRALREGLEAVSDKHFPTIVCADMGMGKTTFVDKVNSTGKFRAYDLEVSDIPGIWGEPDADGNMSLVNGWERLALEKIASMKDIDVVAVTSDRKMVNALIDSGIPFFLAYKDDVAAIRKSIENRTAAHFRNVVKDFGKYIRESSVPEYLKRKMLACSPEAMLDPECTRAIPEEIISSDSFQNDDRYRHWHDMFRLPAGGRKISIMDRNLAELENRLKFFDRVTSPLCRKLRLKGGEYLSDAGYVREILRGTGKKNTHRGDGDTQLIFDRNSPVGCFWIRNTKFTGDTGDSKAEDSYEVIGNNPSRPLCRGTYDRCIRWCRDNGDAYAHMMKRWKSPGNTSKTESMMAGTSNALTEAGANRQSMSLPEELKNTIVEGFKYAIRYGFITRHAMEYQDRHGDMRSYQKSHEIAIRLLDAIKEGNPDVAMIAGPYITYEDGSVRYQAYATVDWKNVIKIISTNTFFPPANPPKLKVLTCFCCDDPNEANKWVKKLAASVGKTLETTNDAGTHKKSANDVARSRGKFIYSEIVRKLSEQYKTDIAPLVRELMQEICRPAGQRDMGKVAELSNKVRGIYAERSELVKQRDEYAWRLFHKRPTDAGERHYAPMSPEELENCVTELHDLNVERAGILNKLSMVKSKLAELQAVPEDEIDRDMLGSLLREKQEITEQRFRVEEKVAACRDRLFGGREGNISF